jgi:putative endonuclease
LYEHNLGHENYTRAGIPWKIVYSKEFSSRSDAQSEEIRIKNRKSRKYILKIINEG